MTQYPNFFSELIKSIFSTSFNLFKLIIPIIIIVKIIEELGGIEYIAIVLEPMMQMAGLPASMGLVWATTMLTNIYGGMIIFIGMAGQESLSVAQVTVLGGMMLIAHALPIELSIIRKAGVRFLYVFLLRVIGAMVVGFVLHQIYSAGDFLVQENQAMWNPALNPDTSLTAWGFNQLKTFSQVFVIIAILMTFLKLLKISGIENHIALALQPLLRVIGLSKNTTSITIIGALLGIIYGGGLLINEAKSGKVDKKEIFGSLTLLALLHSIVEDTILIMLMGAHISGALFFRVFFALIVTAIIIRLIKNLSNAHFYKYFVHSK